MAYVGNLGNIPFLVSSSYMLTFDNYGRSGTGRWAKHDLVGQKPIYEFLGPDVEKITMNISLHTSMNVSIGNILEKLRDMRDTGKAVPLIIGFSPVGQNLWIVESIGETVPLWGKWGTMVSCYVDITLAEYQGTVQKGNLYDTIRSFF